VTGDVDPVNVEHLARRGVQDAVPCATCGKPTSSHVVYSPASSTEVYDVDEQLTEADAGETVTFAVLCHSCRNNEPAADEFDERDEAVFEGVKG